MNGGVGGDDSDRTTDIDGVYGWAVHSPYSPLNLQHLRQPVPRDAPRYYHLSFTFPPWSSSSTSSSSSSSSPSTPSSSSSNPPFTFRDAFEDLLFVSAGYPLPDLHGRQFGRAFEGFPRWGTFGFGPERGLHVADWTAKLGHLGLWHSYFPCVVAPEPYEWGTWWAARLRWLSSTDGVAGEGAGSRLRFKPTMTGDGFESWGKVWDWGWNGKTSMGWPKDAFSPGNEVARTRDATSAGDRDGDDDDVASSASSSTSQPEVEEDLYMSSLASDFPETEDQQLSTAKVITTTTNGTPLGKPRDLPSMNSKTTETTETTENPDGGKTVTTVRRHEDEANKRLEVDTTRDKYDADGNLILRSSSKMSVRTWSSSASSSSSTGENWWEVSGVGSWVGSRDENAPHGVVPDGEAKATLEKGTEQGGKQKSGWFWK